MPRSKRPESPEKPTIGWREWVGLPGLDGTAVKAKVDTGARTSSLHASGVKEFVRDGVNYVRFVIHPHQRRSRPAIPVELPLLARRRVRNSGGQSEVRPVVIITIELMGQQWPIELTLSRRSGMGFRMLLGRQAIRHRFLVDAGRSFLAGRPSVDLPSPTDSKP
ncbi:MAG: ATP-dependent zinc protease [Gemmatimonadetes bacterium]|nr:ATP-dependent zinc protease [Gemmatimonadota bacterium]